MRCLHLLYARFWHKVLYDRGYVSTKEPFQKLVNQGMILGEMEFTGYKNASGDWVSSTDTDRDDNGEFVQKGSGAVLAAVTVEEADVTKKGEGFVLASDANIKIDGRSHKMSKSRGNVVNPDDIVKDYGADSLRLYEMFMGPLEATKPWNMEGVGGIRNFLNRAWRMIVDEKADETKLSDAVQETEPNDDQLRVLHKTIKAVTADLESMGFNTAIARLMEFVNFFTKEKVRPKSTMQQFALLLSPMAPHLAEELWTLLGAKESCAHEPWPEFDPALTVDALVEIPVQIKGKIKAKINVAPDVSKDDLEAAAKEAIAEHLDGQTIKKAIVVPGRLVNFVI